MNIASTLCAVGLSLILSGGAFSASMYEEKDIVLSWQAPTYNEDGTPLVLSDILEYELEALLTDACEDGEWLSCDQIYSWIPESMILVRGTYYYVYEVYYVVIDSQEEAMTFYDVPNFDWVLSMRTIATSGLESERSGYVVLPKEFFLIE